MLLAVRSMECGGGGFANVGETSDERGFIGRRGAEEEGVVVAGVVVEEEEAVSVVVGVTVELIPASCCSFFSAASLFSSFRFFTLCFRIIS